jgi:hypothetical protein
MSIASLMLCSIAGVAAMALAWSRLLSDLMIVVLGAVFAFLIWGFLHLAFAEGYIILGDPGGDDHPARITIAATVGLALWCGGVLLVAMNRDAVDE